MDKKRRAKKEHDFAVTAFRVVLEATGEAKETEPTPEPTAEERRAAAAMLGRRGGLKGGKARAEKLSPEQRKEIARRAARARWGN
jgi:hypothetical protein